MKFFLDNRYIVKNEIPVGNVNGRNRTFILDNTPVPGSVSLFHNGLRLAEGESNDFMISGKNIVFVKDIAPLKDSNIVVDYIVEMFPGG